MKGKIHIRMEFDADVDTKDYPECNGISGIAEYAKKTLTGDFEDEEGVKNIECEAKVLEITENE